MGEITDMLVILLCLRMALGWIRGSGGMHVRYNHTEAARFSNFIQTYRSFTALFVYHHTFFFTFTVW